MRTLASRCSAPATVTVDHVDLERIDLASFVGRARHRLCRADWERCRRYVRLEDVARTVAGKLLLARAFARVAPPGAPLAVRRGRFGKPFVEGHPDFAFNVSHSGRWVVLASGRIPVGIDIEQECATDPDDILPGLSDLDADVVRDPARAICLHDVWTAKEAYAKLLGLGLHADFRSFDGPYVAIPDRLVHIRNLSVYVRRSTHFPGYSSTVAAHAPFVVRFAEATEDDLLPHHQMCEAM